MLQTKLIQKIINLNKNQKLTNIHENKQIEIENRRLS